MIRTQVMICGGTGCTSSNSPLIAEAMEREIREKGLENEVKVVRTGCFGLCAMGPVVIVYPDGTFYSLVKLEDVPEIVEEHLLKGRPVERLVHKDIVEGKAVEVEGLHDIGFYKPQLRVALRNCGLIDPENIEEYIAMDGYRALGKVLTEMTPEQVDALAKLPSREQLLGQLLGTMNAVPTQFVSLFANIQRGLLYALKAIEEQKKAA